MAPAMAGPVEVNWFEHGARMLRYGLRRGEGVPLVLIHEMGGSIESWDLVVPALDPERTVVLAELRGMGSSERVRAPFGFGDLAADVLALLDWLGLRAPVVIAGCAVGAAVALRFTLDHPGRTAGCLALDPAVDTAPGKRPATLALADRMEQEGMRAVEEALLGRTYPEPYREREPAHFHAVRARWLANDPLSFATYLRVLAQTDMAAELARIARPVCFGAGVKDVLRPPDYVRGLARRTPQARFVEIDAGHHVPDHAPNTVAALLEDMARAARSA